ncbi:MAG: DUF192 domain-containing protein [Candidatus Aenigmatarchaeota archaeon]
MEEVEIEAENRTFSVEVSRGFLERAWGLSLRSEGKMLFDFGGYTRASIDMMLLSRPLHLYFLNSDGEVIDARKAEPWSFDPRTWKLYSPGRSYRYLLESFENLELEEGDKLRFDI